LATTPAVFERTSWQVGAYGSLSMGGLFGQAYLGYVVTGPHYAHGRGPGHDREPHGNHTWPGAKASYLMSLVALKSADPWPCDYGARQGERYTEAGDPALTLNVGGQSLKALTDRPASKCVAILRPHPFRRFDRRA